MNYVTAGRQPADALRFFEEISAIPRGSKNEAGIAAYLKKFAEDRGLEVEVDEFYNVIIRKPGSKGCENLPSVMLQGHTDIVCEKNKDVDHDFEKEGLKLQLDGDILTAKGTTLGADDGFAIAYMLAVLDRNDLVHPPLECVMTSMEEIGLVGAMKLKPGMIRSKRMIGMDGGGEGKCLASSAGGNYVYITVPAVWVPAKGQALNLAVRGLLGGHSGGMIDKERGNANKLIARMLYNLAKAGIAFNIASISGGLKSNAIPREADCTILVAPADVARVREVVAGLEALVKNELAFSDKDVRLLVEDGKADRMLDDATTLKIRRLGHLLPNGRQVMSMAIPGLVQASLNVGVVTTDDEKVLYDITVRSAEDSLVRAISDQVLDLAETVGVPAEAIKDYPAFSYVAESPMRELVMGLYEKEFGQKCEIMAVHGGTECGVFRKLVPGMDIASVGPMRGEAHTPDEWMDLASFERMFGFLCKVLEEMTKA